MEREPQINIDASEQVNRPELVPYINRILNAIEHPEAFITDESNLYDFGDFSDIKERKLINVVRNNFGLTVEIDEPFWKIAERIRENNQK